MYQCFKIKRGTGYDFAVKQHFSSLPKWENVFKKVSELLNEKINRMAFNPSLLQIDIAEIKNEENKRLFTKEGKLKQNIKKSNILLEEYRKIINDEELVDFKELGLINFAYGVVRMQGQHLESFRTSEDDIYYKADFDLAQRCKGLVEPITEIEYEEKYLEELKKNSK